MSILDQFLVVRHFETYGQDYVVCRPVLALNFYFAHGTTDIGPAIAGAIEAYMAFIPKNCLLSYKQSNGEDGELTSRTVNRDLKKLRSPDAELMEIRYHSGLPANIGEYGVLLITDDMDPELPQVANLLRFEFPTDLAQESRLEEFIEFVVSLAQKLSFQSATAGYAIGYLGAFDYHAYQLLPGILMRYIAMDPSYDGSYLDMRNATPDAHWVTLLSDELLSPLGGRESLSKALPDSDIREFPSGVLVRAAAVPPLGDVNRGANDLGRLPDLARFMQPTRVKIEHMFSDNFDPARWLARFDDRPSGQWDNRP